ncbi:MAG: hypothetical protein PF501_07455 [Salinisphaera sp.]|jgi:hypothetical protein|nr:hypothetical protein [Salinisphaera sp.]
METDHDQVKRLLLSRKSLRVHDLGCDDLMFQKQQGYFFKTRRSIGNATADCYAVAQRTAQTDSKSLYLFIGGQGYMSMVGHLAETGLMVGKVFREGNVAQRHDGEIAETAHSRANQESLSK